MDRMQYTIRSVSPKLDQALRTRAKQTGQTLNEVALDALAKGSGITASSATYRSLDWFAGSLAGNGSTDDPMQWLDSLPHDLDA